MILDFASFNETFNTADFHRIATKQPDDEAYEFYVDEDKYTATFYTLKYGCYVFAFHKGDKKFGFTKDNKSFRVLGNVCNLIRQFLSTHRFSFFSYVSFDRRRNRHYEMFMDELARKYGMETESKDIGRGRTLYYITNINIDIILNELIRTISVCSFTSLKKANFNIRLSNFRDLFRNSK